MTAVLQTMGSKGVQRIQTAAGDDFDPNTMEAMSTMPCPGGDAKPGAIANVWQVSLNVAARQLPGMGACRQLPQVLPMGHPCCACVDVCMTTGLHGCAAASTP